MNQKEKFSHLIGKTYGKLTILDVFPETDKNGQPICTCRCECGNVKNMQVHALLHGMSKTCGKCVNDLTGRTFGDLTVINRDSSKPSGRGHNTFWICRCSCGGTRSVSTAKLKSGVITHCGCKNKLPNSVHGIMIGDQPYNKKFFTETEKHLSSIFYNMKQRCFDPNIPAYKYYGGRGITICDEWLLDTTNFVQWALANGYQEGLSIDRIDNDGPYAPWNCRWVTNTVQSNNQRSNRRINIAGTNHTLAELCGGSKSSHYIKVRKLPTSEILGILDDEYFLGMTPVQPPKDYLTSP